MSVTIDDVRTSLDDVNQSEIGDDVIEQGIEYAKIELEKGKTVTQSEYDRAVTMWAAHYAFNASPAKTQKSAIDLSTSWDVSSYLEHLEERKRRAREVIGDTQGGRSASFVDLADGGTL